MKRKIIIKLCVFISFIGIFAGCSSTKNTLSQSEAPTMKEIYDAHFESPPADEVHHDHVENAMFERLSVQPLSQEIGKLHEAFSLLPNPMLLIYIPAHLTSGGTPVPGYSTYFSLYERQHVALPSERRATE